MSLCCCGDQKSIVNNSEPIQSTRERTKSRVNSIEDVHGLSYKKLQPNNKSNVKQVLTEQEKRDSIKQISGLSSTTQGQEAFDYQQIGDNRNTHEFFPFQNGDNRNNQNHPSQNLVDQLSNLSAPPSSASTSSNKTFRQKMQLKACKQIVMNLFEGQVNLQQHLPEAEFNHNSIVRIDNNQIQLIFRIYGKSYKLYALSVSVSDPQIVQLQDAFEDLRLSLEKPDENLSMLFSYNIDKTKQIHYFIASNN